MIYRLARLGLKPDRAAHARAAQTAVATGVLLQILLVVGLGEVEGPGGRDLGGDLAHPGRGQTLLVGVARGLGRRALLVVGVVDGRPVLRADVVALTHALRRVVALPEELEHLLVAGLLGVEDDEDGLGVAGAPRADLLIARVGRRAARVADRGGPHARRLPEDALGAPEAAHAELGALQAVGERRRDRMPEHLVGGGGFDRGVAARKGLVGRGNGEDLGTPEGHGSSVVALEAGLLRCRLRRHCGISQGEIPLPTASALRHLAERDPAALALAYAAWARSPSTSTRTSRQPSPSGRRTTGRLESIRDTTPIVPSGIVISLPTGKGGTSSSKISTIVGSNAVPAPSTMTPTPTYAGAASL